MHRQQHKYLNSLGNRRIDDSGRINGFFINLDITKHSRLHGYLNRLRKRRIKDFGRINGSDENLNITNALATTYVLKYLKNEENKGFWSD